MLCSSLSEADVSMPAIFGDNMLLQQETGAPIWGRAAIGERVTVVGSWGESVTTTTGSDGTWKVFLETPSYGGPFEVSIEGNNRISFSNVLIGEVWLCAGQSNMGWRLTATFGGEKEATQANYPGIRIFRSERAHSHEPQTDVKAEWKVCDPQSAGTCSAVTYYFAKKLHEELGVPIGVVLQPYAGTPIEGWMPRDIQLDDPITRAEIEVMDAESAKYDEAVARKQLERQMQLFKEGKRRGEPRLRTPSNWGHQYPGNIFNGMIHPVRPYGIRGAIWYQGERNAKHVAQAANYANQLPMMINYYRTTWHELSGGNIADNFPFYFVQLPSWLPEQLSPVDPDAAWAVSRESMRVVANSVPNVGTAVSLDTGDAINLHPKDKRPIGLRLAYLALKGTYEKNFVDRGPWYCSHDIRGNEVILHFDSIGSGLRSGRSGALDAFAIAGEDRNFVWADANFEGDTIVVSSPLVENPVAVRYAWADNPSRRNLLYNKEGIPASPFRTDDWPLYDAKNYVPVEQIKPKAPSGYTQVEVERPEMTQ